MSILSNSSEKPTISTPVSDPLLSMVSFFESEFSVDWIVELSGQKTSLVLNHLQEQVEAGILKTPKLGIYCFAKPENRAHYQLHLSHEDKQAMHSRIASLLFSELIESDEKYYSIAYHLQQCSNDFMNCGTLAHCGNIYKRTFHTEKAFHCYAKVLDDLAKIKEDEKSDHLFTSIAIGYSKTSTGVQDTPIVTSILHEALKRAKKWGDIAGQALLEMHIAKNEWLQNHFQQAIFHFEAGWTLAKSVNTPEVLRSATSFSTFFLFWQGLFREAIQRYEETFPEIENLSNYNFSLMAAMTVGASYVMAGQISRGLGMLESIRVRCLNIGDRHLASNVIGNVAWAMLELRHTDEMFKQGNEALRLSEETKNHWTWIVMQLLYAYAYYLKGDSKRSIAYLKNFFKRSRRVHAVVSFTPYLLELGWAIEQGMLPKIKGFSLENEVEDMIHSENLYVKGIAYRFKAKLQEKSSESSEIIVNSHKSSIHYLSLSGAKLELVRSQLQLSSYLAQGKHEEANHILAQASEELTGLSETLLPDDLRGIINLHDDTIVLKEITSLGREIVLMRNTKQVLNQIIAAMNRLFNAERGAIFLRNDNASSDYSKLYLRASNNLSADDIKHPNFFFSMKMIEETFKTKKGKNFNRDNIEKGSMPVQDNVSSIVCAPMMFQDDVIGVLYNDNRLLKTTFKESDFELLNYFAGQAALAIENDRAREEISNLNKKINMEKQFYEEQHQTTLHFGEIIGGSTAIKKVLLQIEQVASTDATVLILGETGTGKELVARAIHQNGNRKDKSFVCAHISAMPESLISNELFGHEKGAYTNAEQRRIGRFELADGGTIFLDEIGELTQDVQIRLLRVLQTHEFERIGSPYSLKSDFRLIAATNRNLEQLVTLGRFRSDLFYRINVFPIFVPPLRERKEDIPDLAEHFLSIHSDKLSKTFNRISKEELNKLMQYDWPGNIRELANIIERGVILSKGPRFELPHEIFKHHVRAGNDKHLTLEENERHHIIQTLEKTNWKVSGFEGAAELLKVNPSTLAFRIRKLNIKRAKRFTS